MSDMKTRQSQLARQGTDLGRVGRAAAELGVEVPRGFWLIGVGEDGRHISGCAGGADDLRVASAICRRLDGLPVTDCWVDPDPSNAEKPAWASLDDWTDTDAMLAYLEERDRHPEWPRIQNSWGDVAAFLLGVGGNATWDGLKWLARRVRVAARSELSREDAILIGGHALVSEFVRLGLELPSLQDLEYRADQLKNGDWSLLFYSQHVVVRVDLPDIEFVGSRSDVTILRCPHGLGGW